MNRKIGIILQMAAILSFAGFAGNCGDIKEAVQELKKGITSSCGDGIVDQSLREQCDDGNTVSGDGCDSQCFLERNICGNSVVETINGEQCDDGNLVAGDGCDATCHIEPYCGDFIVTYAIGEQCDDGNLIPGDGCDASCQTEATCGNGMLEPGEQCDDGNQIDNDACSNSCTINALSGFPALNSISSTGTPSGSNGGFLDGDTITFTLNVSSTDEVWIDFMEMDYTNYSYTTYGSASSFGAVGQTTYTIPVTIVGSLAGSRISPVILLVNNVTGDMVEYRWSMLSPTHFVLVDSVSWVDNFSSVPLLIYDIDFGVWPPVGAIAITVDAGVMQTVTIPTTGIFASFPVTQGTQYTVTWDDSYDGSGIYPADAMVTAWYESQALIFQNKDCGFSTTNCTWEVPVGPYTFLASETGNVYLWIIPYDAFSAGNIGVRVDSGAGGGGPVTTPLTVGAANAINGNLTGTMDTYALTVTAGNTYSIWWDDAYEGNGASTLDVWVDVLDSAGNFIGSADSGFFNAGVVYLAPINEDITIQVTPYYYGDMGTYSIWATSP